MKKKKAECRNVRDLPKPVKLRSSAHWQTNDLEIDGYSEVRLDSSKCYPFTLFSRKDYAFFPL